MVGVDAQRVEQVVEHEVEQDVEHLVEHPDERAPNVIPFLPFSIWFASSASEVRERTSPSRWKDFSAAGEENSFAVAKETNNNMTETIFFIVGKTVRSVLRTDSHSRAQKLFLEEEENA